MVFVLEACLIEPIELGEKASNTNSKKMNYILKKTILKLVCFLMAELYLNWLGLDDLADYSEFIFEKNLTAVSASQSLIVNGCLDLEKEKSYFWKDRLLV